MIYCKSIREFAADLGRVAVGGVLGLAHYPAAYLIPIVIYIEEKAEENAKADEGLL